MRGSEPGCRAAVAIGSGTGYAAQARRLVSTRDWKMYIESNDDHALRAAGCRNQLDPPCIDEGHQAEYLLGC